MSISWRKNLTLTKDPDSILDYELDWDNWLATGDSVSSVSFSSTSGITIDSSSISGNSTIVWLSGGTAGSTYTITAHMTTGQSREVDRSFRIRIKEL